MAKSLLTVYSEEHEEVVFKLGFESRGLQPAFRKSHLVNILGFTGHLVMTASTLLS